jgi:hypothetical protein
MGGRDASAGDGPVIVERLKELLGSEKYAREARQFAARHRWFEPRPQAEQMLSRMIKLLEESLPTAA